MKFWIGVSALVLSQALLSAQNKPLTVEEMHRLHQDSKAYIASLEDPDDVFSAEGVHTTSRFPTSLSPKVTYLAPGEIPGTSPFRQSIC